MRLAPLSPKTAALAICLAGALGTDAFAQLHPADAVNARQAQSMGFDGRGTTVVVIDPSGFATNSPALQGKIVGEACFNTDGAPTPCPNGQPSQVGAGAASVAWPASAHGTEIAEFIAGANPSAMGVAPGASIFAIRVSNTNGQVNQVTAREALNYVYYTLRTQFNIAAVVTAFVPSGAESGANLCGESSYRYAVQTLRQVGIATTMPAGDSGYTSALQFDGCRLEALAVSAFNSDNTPSTTSNFSQNIAFGAIAGPNLLSTAGDGVPKTIPNVSSSWAAGLSAGGFAVLRTARPNASVDAIEAALKAGGLPVAISDPTAGSTLPRYVVRRIDVSNALNYLIMDHTPEAGFWWNPNESGRGYFVDVQGNAMFFGAFMYNGSGQPEWYVGRLAQSGPNSFTGSIYLYTGGQPINGPGYTPPTPVGAVATVTLNFTATDVGTLAMQTPSTTVNVAIQRYRYFYDNQPFNVQRPVTGWYWDPSKSGSGIAFEDLGNSVYIVPFAYDSTGRSQWVGALGSTNSSQFMVTSQPVLYANGQTMTGPYQPPQAASQPMGTVTFQATAPHVLTVVYGSGFRADYMPFRFLD